MKQINYKQLKNIANLPSYDVGTRPIGSGFQRNDDLILLGYTTQQAAPITNNFVPEAKAEAILFGASKVLPFAQSVGKYITTYNSALLTAMNDAVASAGVDASGNLMNGATEAGIKASAKGAAKGAASKALGAANVAMNAYSAVKGTVDTLKNWSDSSTLTAGDLYNSAQQNTEYVNGVAYNTMGGIDDKGFNDYVKAQNKANTIGGAMSGAEAGMGIGGLVGSIFTPLGSLIGSGIGGLVGGLVGALGGHRARERRRRLMEEAKRNYMLAANAQNTQNYSDAVTQSMQNDYYATHADKGLPISEGEPNALVGGGESLVGTDGNGNVTSVMTMQESGKHPRRLDNIAVKLDKGTGVAGNKIDPMTGLTIAEKVAPLAALFNSTKNPHYRRAIGKRIKAEMDLQDLLPDNNPNPYEQGLVMANQGLSPDDPPTVVSQTRPYMTDDYFYRLSKTNPGVDLETIQNAYDTAHISTIDDNVYDISLGGSYASYVPAVSKEYYNLVTQRRANKNGIPNIFSTDHSSIYLRPKADAQTLAHEINHLYDEELPDLYKMNEESVKTLMNAYPQNIMDLLPESNYLKEAHSTNTELRKHISELNDGVMGEALDKVIDNISDADLYKLYAQQNGYTIENDDYFKPTAVQEFLDYQKTDDYKNVYQPYAAHKDALENNWRVSRLGTGGAKKAAKTKYKELLKSGPTYLEGFVPTDEQLKKAEYMFKYQHMPIYDQQQRSFDHEKFNRMRKALKEVAYNQNQTGGDLYMADKGKSINNMKTRKYLSYLPMFDVGWPPFFPTEPQDTGEGDVVYTPQTPKKKSEKKSPTFLDNLVTGLKGMDGAQYPLMSYLGNYLANKSMQKEVRNSKIHAFNPYTPSNGEYAVNMMHTQYDITPQKYALYGALRHGLYNVDQDGTASAGMRQARKNNLFNNYMRGVAGLMSEKFNKENEMMSNKAKLMYQALSDEANRRYQGNAQYYDQLAKGYGQRNNQLMALKATMPKDFDRLMQNLSNIRYQNKYLDMVYQDLTRDQKNILAKK